MQLYSRKIFLMGVKEDWTNGKPMEEQQGDFSRLKAVHSCLPFETPCKSIVQYSILADEVALQAMDLRKWSN